MELFFGVEAELCSGGSGESAECFGDFLRRGDGGDWKGGGDGNYLCRFLPITVLLFQIFVQLIMIRCEGVLHPPSEVIKTE